jgi:hypothetical protein
MVAQYFAQIDQNNIVINVHVVTAEFMAANPERYPGVWVETFFDTKGKTYAGVGMTSKKISKAKRQIGDQTTKGGVIGIMIYALSTNNVDPVLIGLLVPVASSVLAWISTKIGDPDLACLFIPNDDDKPKN